MKISKININFIYIIFLTLIACNKDESIAINDSQTHYDKKNAVNNQPINKASEPFIIVDTLDYIETEAELDNALQLLTNNQALLFSNNQEQVFVIENKDGSSPTDDTDEEISVVCEYANSAQKAGCFNSAMQAIMYNIGQGGCPIVTGGDGIVIVLDHPCLT